jgi:hypothetical protein
MSKGTVSLTYVNDSGGKALSAKTEITDANFLGGDWVVPASTTNQLVAIAFAFAKLDMYVFLSNVDVTIKTNSTTSPGNTITLKAGQMKLWSSSNYGANEFTADVTTFYLTNANAQQATISFRAHLTP